MDTGLAGCRWMSNKHQEDCLLVRKLAAKGVYRELVYRHLFRRESMKQQVDAVLLRLNSKHAPKWGEGRNARYVTLL